MLLIKTLKVEDAKKLLKNDNYLFIDLRDYRELIKNGKYLELFLVQEAC